MRLILLTLFIGTVIGEEGPPAPVEFAKRMMSTLPDLPQAIAGSLEGKSDGIKSMISSVLGDGLISQLVVNPIGMAEEVLPDLGLNKTQVLGNLNSMSGGAFKSNSSQFSSSFFGKNSGLLGMFTTTPPTTTTQVMLVDGVPVKDFDEYIRKNNLENNFSTNKPPPATTPPPSADEMIERIANRVTERIAPPAPPASMNYPKHPDDFASTLNMAMVDPKRIKEVNTLLRRAPQHFGGDSMDVFGNPPGFVQAVEPPSSLDPAIDNVVTAMRTRGIYGLSTLDIKRMKDILNTYEATLQTKEFISKRNQLQVLQVELEEQRKRIELQKKMEAELHEKAKEMEEKKRKMEAQLREQLHSWNLTHLINENGPHGTQNLIDLPELNPAAFPQLVDSAISAAPPSFLTEEELHTDTTVTEEPTTTTTTTTTTEMPMPPPSTAPSPLRLHPRDFRRENVRFSPKTVSRIPSSTAIQKDYPPQLKCNCQQISAAKLRGKWIPALASKTMLATVYERVSELLHTDAPSSLSCSRFQVSPFKRSASGEDARIMWEFQMTNEDTLHRMQGNAVVKDRREITVNLKSSDGDSLGFPMCILKTDASYSYVVAVNSQGPCDQATLLVRNPDQFFSDTNDELVAYLKTKVATRELEKLDMLTFAQDCE